MIRRTVLALSFGASAAGIRNKTKANTIEDVLPKDLTDQWAHDAGKIPLAGLSVSVTRDGQAPLFWSYGYAELPFKTPVSRTTLFPIGSISKHITALGVLRLKEAGAIGLDDSISIHLKNSPPAWSKITIRNLLTHTSGIADYWKFFPDFDRDHTRAEILEKLSGAPTAFTPGQAWAYNSMNYRMLGWIISDVSGLSYSEFMRAQVFDHASLPEARIDAAENVIPLRAEGYDWKNGQLLHTRLMTNEASASGAGGVLFSGVDSPLWETALSGNRLISEQDKTQSFAPAMLTSGLGVPYGFGWYLGHTRGHDYYWHGGSEPGYMGQYMRFPSAGVSIFVSANTFGPSGFLGRVPFQVIEHYKPGSTYISAPEPVSQPDERSHILVKVLGSPAIPDEYLSTEARLMKLYQGGDFGVRIKDSIISALPLESYQMAATTMVRYRVRTKDYRQHVLVGWTADNRISWIES